MVHKLMCHKFVYIGVETVRLVGRAFCVNFIQR